MTSFVFAPQAAALFSKKSRRGRHLESFMSNRKIRLRQSMQIFLKNISAVFHPNLIKNNEA